MIVHEYTVYAHHNTHTPFIHIIIYYIYIYRERERYTHSSMIYPYIDYNTRCRCQGRERLRREPPPGSAFGSINSTGPTDRLAGASKTWVADTYMYIYIYIL